MSHAGRLCYHTGRSPSRRLGYRLGYQLKSNWVINTKATGLSTQKRLGYQYKGDWVLPTQRRLGYQHKSDWVINTKGHAGRLGYRTGLPCAHTEEPLTTRRAEPQMPGGAARNVQSGAESAVGARRRCANAYR